MDETNGSTDPSDQALDDPALNELFNELRSVADRPAPKVHAELSAVLAGATPMAAARVRRSRAARSGIIGLVTAGLLTGGLGAAAADELPRPAQRIVSRVVNGLTPFTIPAPDEQGPDRHDSATPIDDQPSPDVDRSGDDAKAPDVTHPAEQGDSQRAQSGGNRSGGNRSGGNRSGGEPTGGEHSGDDPSDRERSTGVSDDQGPSGDGSDRQRSDSDTPSGSVESDDVSTSDDSDDSGTSSAQQGTESSGQD